MTYTPPCHERPDDWFIEKDGKQYPDDVLLTSEEIEEIRQGILANGEHYTDPEAAIAVAVRRAEERAKTRALARRRHARADCYACEIRLQCLSVGLEEQYGIRGGYYPEERREIVRLRNEKERARHA